MSLQFRSSRSQVETIPVALLGFVVTFSQFEWFGNLNGLATAGQDGHRGTAPTVNALRQ
jgi:hypothetical protein